MSRGHDVMPGWGDPSFDPFADWLRMLAFIAGWVVIFVALVHLGGMR